MDLTKKKYIYANGSSVTAGGGFELYEHRTDVREKYEEKGIKLPETQIECSYPYFVAEKLGLKCLNKAKSGSGVDRMIRTTFEWIMKHPYETKQTIFLFEPQTGIRLDWYVKEWDDFGVLNAHYDEKGEYPFTLVKEWFVDDSDEQVRWNEKYESAITPYLSNFYDHEVHSRLETAKLLFFISYLNQKGIDYLLSIPNGGDFDIIEDLISITPKDNQINTALEGFELWHYAHEKNYLIADEVDHGDNHIGFFGNKKIGEQIAKYIEQRWKSLL